MDRSAALIFATATNVPSKQFRVLVARSSTDLTKELCRVEGLLAIILSLFVLWGAFLLLKKFWPLAVIVVLAVIFAGGDKETTKTAKEQPIQADHKELDLTKDPNPIHPDKELKTEAGTTRFDPNASSSNQDSSSAPNLKPPQMGTFKDRACMAYRHLLPPGTVIHNAWNATRYVKDAVEFEWLLWQRNIDPLTVQETGLVCAYNDTTYVIHEFIFQSQRQGILYEKTAR